MCTMAVGRTCVGPIWLRGAGSDRRRSNRCSLTPFALPNHAISTHARPLNTSPSEISPLVMVIVTLQVALPAVRSLPP